MFRMSGVAVAMAGLAASGLLYAVWSWDTTPFKAPTKSAPLTTEASTATDAAFEFGNALVLHSGAWRASPAEQIPPVEANTAPASQAVMVPASADPAPQPARPKVPPTGRAPEAVTEPLATAPSEAPQVEAGAQPAAIETAPPAPRNRMSLAGPKLEAADRPHADAGRHSPRQPPGGRTQAAEPEALPLAAPPKFGPEVFKKLESIGGF